MPSRQGPQTGRPQPVQSRLAARRARVPEGTPLPLGPALRSVAIVGPPVTIGTALLFYFGWARTSAQAAAMGLDESIFAMGTRDYVLRSLDALYVPVLVSAVCVLLWILVHGWLLDELGEQRHVRAIAAAARVFTWSAWWSSAAVAGLLAVLLPGTWTVIVPLALAVGLLLTEYGIRLRGHSDVAAGRRHIHRPPWVSALRTVLIGVLVTVLLFWEVAEYAEVVGRGRAADVVASVDQRPSVVVYSERDLHLETTGIATRPIGDELSRYRFRYDGLRLLQHTGDTFFLVPDGWRPGSPSLVVLPQHPSLRMEFAGPPA